MSNIRVKVCCISSIQEADLAIAYGATAIGLVGPMPTGPGIISNETIRKIVHHVTDDVETFFLTSEVESEGINMLHNITQTTTIQLVDKIKCSYESIYQKIDNTKLVQVIHVISDEDIDLALQSAEHVDAILLDSGNPNLKTKVLGGTGRTHNWSISKRIVEQCPKPVYLAGGLNSDNVLQAIEKVQPYGVDLCSGLRTYGKLDEQKLSDFFNKIKSI